MNSPNSSGRALLTILATMLVVTAFALVGLHALQLEQRLGNSAKENYVKGYLAARESYKSSCILPAQDANHFFGHVKSIGPDSITVIQESFDTDPIVDGVSNTRIAIVTSATILQRVIKKSPEQFRDEIAAFIKQKETKTVPPSNVITKPIPLTHFKEGDRVFVQSSRDVRLQETFDATLIQIIE